MKYFLFFFIGIVCINAQEFEWKKVNDKLTVVSTINSDGKILRTNKRLNHSPYIYLDTIPSIDGLKSMNFDMVWEMRIKNLLAWCHAPIMDFRKNNVYYFIEDRSKGSLTFVVFIPDDNIDKRKADIISDLKRLFQNVSLAKAPKTYFEKEYNLKNVPYKVLIKIPFSRDNYFRLLKWIEDNKDVYYSYPYENHPERYRLMKVES